MRYQCQWVWAIEVVARVWLISYDESDIRWLALGRRSLLENMAKRREWSTEINIEIGGGADGEGRNQDTTYHVTSYGNSQAYTT